MLLLYRSSGTVYPIYLLVILSFDIYLRLFCFGSLVILDVTCCYLWLFSLYINIKVGKNIFFYVRLAGDHLYGKQLFTWLSLVVSLMASFVLSFFPLDVLDEIWDLIESVSEGFLTYSCKIQ